jgi:CheY-like chemotaxis protein
MSRIRILIVDDNRPLATLVGLRLEQTGHYTVRIESKPHVAIPTAREFQPHLMLLDVDMPGMTGPELQRAVQKEPGFSEVPVIFLTSLISADEAGEREMISNGSRFLSKSAKTEVVHRCITRAISESASLVSLK